MKEQPLVSVIIPVYNVERYLAQCLDSVINQTYPNLEIICVNDGSRDGSPDILRRYADEDAWIQVIDKANGGVSQARNDALDCARGEYIMFVDSDDWVEPDACENAVNAMREYDADIVMWSYVSETENRSSRKVIFPETTVFEKEEVRAKLHRRFVGAMGEELSHPELVDSLCPVWGKLYRRSLIQKSGRQICRSGGDRKLRGRLFQSGGFWKGRQGGVSGSVPVSLPQGRVFLGHVRVQPKAV